MEEFFMQGSRDLEEATLTIQNYWRVVEELREKCCELELSLTALHKPDHEMTLKTVVKLTENAKELRGGLNATGTGINNPKS